MDDPQGPSSVQEQISRDRSAEENVIVKRLYIDNGFENTQATDS